MVTKLDANQLATRYGYAASFFNAVPELKKLLAQAVAAQWSAEEFSARFLNSSWYKYHSSSLKEWSALKAKEPAEVSKRIADRKASLQAQTAKLGITMDPKRLQQLSEWSLMYQWDEGALNRALAAEMHYDPAKAQLGEVGSMQSQIRENAAAYGVSYNDKDIWSMSQKMVEGSLSQEGVLEQIKKLAMSRFPGLVDEINKGLSVREIASAYVQAQSRLLEIDPNQIDLATDSSLQKALQAKGPDGKPLAGGMPLWQYEQDLRKDSRWLNTSNAKQEMNGVASKVLKDFGLQT